MNIKITRNEYGTLEFDGTFEEKEAVRQELNERIKKTKEASEVLFQLIKDLEFQKLELIVSNHTGETV